MSDNYPDLLKRLVRSIESRDELQSLILLSKFESVDIRVRTRGRERYLLNLATEFELVNLLEAMIPKVKNIDVEDYYSWSSLHMAAVNDYPDILNILLDNGATINQRSANGNTALHLAAQNDCMVCVKALLERGADTSAQNSWGKTPYKVALDDGYYKCADLIESYMK